MSNDMFNELKSNVWYSCDLKEPRNPVFHAKLFAVLQETLDNLPEESGLNKLDTYGLLKAIEFEIGEVEQIRKLNGEMVLVPKSIAFENMDNIEFGKMYEKIVAICETLIGAKFE